MQGTPLSEQEVNALVHVYQCTLAVTGKCRLISFISMHSNMPSPWALSVQITVKALLAPPLNNPPLKVKLVYTPPPPLLGHQSFFSFPFLFFFFLIRPFISIKPPTSSSVGVSL